MTSLSFPESYDELAILAHYGATPEELTRRLAEREAMGQLERFHADTQARSHCGPTLADHRARWATADEPAGHYPTPWVDARPGEALPDLPASAYPPGAIPLNSADPEDVPTGTVADVLDWVGGDRDRARAALDDEQARARSRSSLVDALRKVLTSDG